MNDKYLMENVMFGSKVMADLYLHGVIESTNENVNGVFSKALTETLKMHHDLFKEMETNGFYSLSNVDESKIKQKKKSLECECTDCLEKNE
ncbi:MAG: spore coat protein [Bacilli bacterium]|jgi:spore coat protein CotF|nr:spore coat protein [Bacilli bacterium]